jgi:sulfate/thiosulfate transport system substrate-binding protein
MIHQRHRKLRQMVGAVVTGLVIAWLPAAITFPSSLLAADSRELVLAAYSVPKEAYEKHIIPAFQRQWKQKTGQDLAVRTSYGASGAQARAIIGGFEADVAALPLSADLGRSPKAGLITHDWKKAPDHGVVSASVVAFGVRKGNPKGIKTWEDLARPGVAVLYPNPKTSGGAMWDVMAIYGAGLKLAGPKPPAAAEVQAADLLKRIQKNVKVMDKSGRESVTTFERGVGDVIITYENELLPRVKSGRPYDVIVPAQTIFVENPVAIVDRNVDKHKNRDLAEAFVAFLRGEDAQRAFRDLGFRPALPPAAGGAAGTFPIPAQLFTVEELGGWAKVEPLLFGPQGLWTRTVEELARGR